MAVKMEPDGRAHSAALAQVLALAPEQAQAQAVSPPWYLRFHFEYTNSLYPYDSFDTAFCLPGLISEVSCGPRDVPSREARVARSDEGRATLLIPTLPPVWLAIHASRVRRRFVCRSIKARHAHSDASAAANFALHNEVRRRIASGESDDEIARALPASQRDTARMLAANLRELDRPGEDASRKVKK